VFIYIYIYIYIHTHTHTHTYTYIHIPNRSMSNFALKTSSFCIILSKVGRRRRLV
jgi:hypothetical protein